jgi:MoaA/NifB/PqqE/SkfB family radical SAM enzyme
MQRHSRPFNLREFKVEVTYRCDLNCVHCSSDARPSNPLEMTRNDCLRILSDAAQMGARDVAFSGGEPLLWPHVFEVVKAAAKHRLKGTIYTSGNAEDFKDKAECLHSLGASHFIFSVFGAIAATHELAPNGNIGE